VDDGGHSKTQTDKSEIYNSIIDAYDITSFSRLPQASAENYDHNP